ncbi:hypothetical protein [Acetobacter musti]|uniref:hypothetical protein n=1 Tax=Acetobacter musti TaxID=864732 RepID=UPI001F54FB8D|nr:hypothetical protein [Acetobacter musti]
MSGVPILCERIRTPPLDPAFLKPTRWATVEEKAKLGNAMLRFIAEGMPAGKFTASLYKRLSNMFGFIAHYDRHGFAQTWFDSAATRRDFLDRSRDIPAGEIPALSGRTWSGKSASVSVRTFWSRHGPSRAGEDQNAREKAELGRLMAKHGVAPVSPVAAAPAVQLGLF